MRFREISECGVGQLCIRTDGLASSHYVVNRVVWRAMAGVKARMDKL